MFNIIVHICNHAYNLSHIVEWWKDEKNPGQTIIRLSNGISEFIPIADTEVTRIIKKAKDEAKKQFTDQLMSSYLTMKGK